MEKDKIVVLDFGSQYNQLIVRRIRSFGVYSVLLPYTTDIDILTSPSVKGIILSGGPDSVYESKKFIMGKEFWKTVQVPVLGICYGLHHMVSAHGGKIKKSKRHEYGATNLIIDDIKSPLFTGLLKKSVMWMSHKDEVVRLPAHWDCIAHSKNCQIAAVVYKREKKYGIQFHPEVTHSKYGVKLLKNFVLGICKTQATWHMKQYLNDQVKSIKSYVKDSNVICALSGGVDSAVVAALLSKAIGKSLHCIFVDHGLLRKNEREEVEKVFTGKFKNSHLHVIDASKQFFAKLKDISDPEQKRKIIGKEFIQVFNKVAKKISKVKFLAQGTLYTDVVESGSGGMSKMIKSHHNVGGMPKNIQFTLIEPLKLLFKDEVRQLGLEAGLTNSIVYRQPFPGPGIAIRIIGNVTEEKASMVRESDAILRKEIARAGLDKTIWQYFTVYMGVKTVGVKGDARVYGDTIALRAVHSQDGMSVSIAHIPYEVLEIISSRIVNEIDGITRVVYDISSKPPSTIEWE